jgi:hypothetical protein
MAAVLGAAFGGDVSAARIAREMDCSEEQATRLALMRAPRIDRDEFRRDVALIAQDVGIDVGRLTMAVRVGRAVDALGKSESEPLLAAARDRLDRNDEI